MANDSGLSCFVFLEFVFYCFKNRFAYAHRAPVSKTSYSTSLKSLTALPENTNTTFESPQSQEKNNKTREENLNNFDIQPGKTLEIKGSTIKMDESTNREIRQEGWILNQNPDLYTIQLLATVDRDLLVKFVDRNNLVDRVAFFHRYHNGGDWYSLIFGLYPSWSEAMKTLKDLPEYLTKASPWVIRINSVQDIITMKGKPDNQ